MTYVSRDPFARTELHKRSMVIGATASCDWCGGARERKSGARYLYVYSTETDGGRKFEHRGRFCCKSCHDSYHS